MLKNKENFFTPKNWILLLMILLICRIFCMWFMPVVDPSESRYANIGKNMAVHGNFLEPQFVYNGVLQNFEGKPPLFFQSSGVSCFIFGQNEFAVRFPALLSAAVILSALYFTGRRLRDRKTAFCAVLLCLLTPVFLIFAGLCMTDLMLAASIVCAVFSYMLFSSETERKKKKWFSIGFFASLGAGMMVKGPVALVMAGMPVFLFVLIGNRWKELKDHAWLTGSLVFLLIAVPWYWMMQQKNPDFLEYFFINENFKRFLFKEYGDRYGSGRETFRGMSFVFYLLCNLPFLLCVILPVFFRRKELPGIFVRWKEFLKEPLTGLALLLILTNTLFWALTSRVLITYLLPTIPMTALLIAEFLFRSRTMEKESSFALIRKSLFAMWLVSCLICAAAPFLAPYLSDNVHGHFFRRCGELKEYADYPVYFMRRTPLCAEFYLGKRVKNHPSEYKTVAVQASRNMLLIADEDDWEEQKKTASSRKILLRFGGRVLLAPEKSNTK